HAHPAMIIWATFAMLITATPIFAWRNMLRQPKRKSRRRKPRHAAGTASRAEALAAAGKQSGSGSRGKHRSNTIRLS
ncbi:glycosyl transferase, partial [Streptomyces sp. M41]